MNSQAPITIEVRQRRDTYYFVSRRELGHLGVQGYWSQGVSAIAAAFLGAWLTERNAWALLAVAVVLALVAVLIEWRRQKFVSTLTNGKVVSLDTASQPAQVDAVPPPESPPSIAETSGFRIVRALYGAKETFIDVTDVLKELTQDNRLEVDATNALAGDPVENVVKVLRITYMVDGVQIERSYDEGDHASLP